MEFNGVMGKIKEVSNYECDYEKDYMKIKFNSGDNLPLNKPLKVHNMTITIRSVFKGISEGIDVNETNLLKECDVCLYWCFKDIGFKHEPYLCNGCHNLMQKAMSFNNISINIC